MALCEIVTENILVWIPSLPVFSLTAVFVGNRKRGLYYFTRKKNQISSLRTSHQIVLLIAEETKNLVCQSEPQAFRVTFLRA